MKTLKSYDWMPATESIANAGRLVRCHYFEGEVIAAIDSTLMKIKVTRHIRPGCLWINRIGAKCEVPFSSFKVKVHKSGFDAMGIPVPANRLNNGYLTVQEILGCGKEIAFSIVSKAKQIIERDQPFDMIGATSSLDKDLAKLDLTGRYRLLSVLLND